MRSLAALAIVLAGASAHADRRSIEPPRAIDPVALAARGWRVTPGWIAGSQPAPGASRDPAAAERAARATIAALAPWIAPGTRAADWVATANRVDGDKRTVAFRQTWRGLPVEGGALAVVIAHDRIFAIATRAFANVAPSGARVDGAVVVALPDGSFALARAIIESRAVTRYVALADPAHELARRDARRHATGTLLFDVPVRYPGGTRTQTPAAFADVTGDGAPLTTDAGGALTWGTATPLAVAPTTSGPHVAVTSVVGASTAGLSLPDGGTVTWSAPTTETTDAELSAFVHVSLAKLAARGFIPALATWLDTPLAVSVNATDANCNAFTDPDGIHFYRATATCENTGRLADVIYHEFGHALHEQATELGMGGVTEGALGEGVADFNAANLTGDSGIGRGFHFTDAPLREIDPPGRDLRWPEDTHVAADTHGTGLIVSGALWDVRTLGGAALGAQSLRAVLERAADIPASYTAALVEDDDNADLTDGTPHGCAIGEAFARHGLAPDFATTTVGAPAITGLAVSVPVTIPTTNTACPPPAVVSATLHWHRANEASADVALAVDGDGTHYTGAIPPQPDPTLVYFSIDVALANGLSVALPSNRADPEYTAFTGTVTPLYCASMDADPQWTTSGAGWQYANPPTSAAPDPAAPHTGTGAYGTVLTGDGLYASGTMATATLPPIDPAGFAHVHLQFYRWLTSEDALYDRASIAVNGTEVWANVAADGTLDHADREWRFQDVDLSAQLAPGMPLSIAFGLATDQLGSLGGWTLDDVCVVGLGPGCGDGVVEADRGEECDDGNRVDGDGCSATCTEELPAAPPPGCCETSPTPSGVAIGLVLLGLRRRRRARTRAHDTMQCPPRHLSHPR